MAKDEKDKTFKIAWDVDGTLIHSGDPDFKDSKGEPLDSAPRYTVVNLFKAFELLGAEMFIWSSEGKDHARLWKKRLGLDAKVIKKEKRDDIDLAIDNKDSGLAKMTFFV